MGSFGLGQLGYCYMKVQWLVVLDRTSFSEWSFLSYKQNDKKHVYVHGRQISVPSLPKSSIAMFKFERKKKEKKELARFCV